MVFTDPQIETKAARVQRVLSRHANLPVSVSVDETVPNHLIIYLDKQIDMKVARGLIQQALGPSSTCLHTIIE